MQHLILGLWPIAGVTTIGVTREDARATIRAAIDAGIHRFDTAYSYGYDGESDRLIGEFLNTDRDAFEVIGKVGQRWTPDRMRVVDGSKATLIADANESLGRIGIDSFDVLMLHSPDPNIPVAESAETMRSLVELGVAKSVGFCNATDAQRREFAEVVDCQAIQCPLNLLQSDSLDELIPSAASAGTQPHVYWTLMKGLLAGKITRDHVFAEGDSRPKYEVFQGEARQRAHRIVDALSLLAGDIDKTVAQLAIGWAASQPGVDAALVGARYPQQATEVAESTRLPTDVIQRIDEIVAGE